MMLKCFLSHYRDLHTANILLNDKGKMKFFVFGIFLSFCSGEVRLTYMGKWDYVNHTIKHGIREKLYVAPGELIRVTCLEFVLV